MFYTLVSKIPLISGDRSNKKFFKIFIFGSIAYILLHYYLYSGEKFAFLEKLKSYLYYVMAVDLALAYYLSKSSITPDEDDEEKRDCVRGEYSDNQRVEIEKGMQELRKMQMAQTENNRQKMLEQQYLEKQQLEMENKNEDTKSGSSQKSPFMTRDEIKATKGEKSKKDKSSSSESTKKKTTSESSSESIPVKKEVKKKSKKDKIDTDTVNIPVYIPKH